MKHLFQYTIRRCKLFFRDESGSAMEEYLIIGALIVVVVITVVAGIGSTESQLAYDKVEHGLKVR